MGIYLNERQRMNADFVMNEATALADFVMNGASALDESTLVNEC
jgi:hypothetical protein